MLFSFVCVWDFQSYAIKIKFAHRSFSHNVIWFLRRVLFATSMWWSPRMLIQHFFYHAEHFGKGTPTKPYDRLWSQFFVMVTLCYLCFSGNLLTQENISGVLTEVPPLISESDLHISQVRASTQGLCFTQFVWNICRHCVRKDGGGGNNLDSGDIY